MKNLLILIILPCLLTGQNTFNVQSNFGYPFADYTSVYPTDSCYYVTGVITDTTNGQYKIGNIFIKFDLNGDTVFTKTLLSADKYYQTWVGDIISTPDHNLLDIGQTSDSLIKSIIIVYSPTGDTLYTKEYLSPYHPQNSFILPFGVVHTAAGEYAILNDIEKANGNNDLSIAFFNQQLEMIDHKIYGNQYDEIPGCIIEDGDGGLIIGANRDNTNLVNKNFWSKTYIFKTNSTGTVQWEYLSPSGQLQDIAHDMVKTPDGGLVVASGKGIEHPVNIETGVLRWHGYVFKINNNQQFEWGRELRGTRHSGSTKLIKIIPASGGTGFVTYGNLLENKSVGTEQYGSWIVKISNTGDSLWARYYTFFDGHDRAPEPTDFKATPDGGYVVSGQTREGLLNFGWLMKLDSFGCLIPGCQVGDSIYVTARDIHIEVPAELAIYPNPTSDYLNFQLRTPENLRQADFRILDVSGRVVKVFSSDYPKDTVIVPVWDWAPGVYFLEASAAGRVLKTEKFVITK